MSTLTYGIPTEVFKSMDKIAQDAIKTSFEKQQAELAKAKAQTEKRIVTGLNEVRLIGRIGKDIEVSYVTKKNEKNEDIQEARAFFNLAVPSFPGSYTTQWIPVTVWGKHAEACKNFVGKGSLIAVTGALENRANKDGNGFYTGVRADRRTGMGVIFLQTNKPGTANEVIINPETGEVIEPSLVPDISGYKAVEPALNNTTTEVGF